MPAARRASSSTKSRNEPAKAEAVRQALTARYRVDAAKLTPAGFGASRAKEPNTTPEGRARNRRVELVRQ